VFPRLAHRLVRFNQSYHLPEHVACARESVATLPVNLCHVHELKLASLVHGGGWQELESFLDFGRLGVGEEDEGLEFGSI